MSNGISEFFSDIYGGLSQIGSAVSPAIPAVAGSLLTKEAYDRLSDIGTQSLTGVTVDGQRVPGAMEVAERGQRESQFRPFTVTTPTGSMFSARMGGQPSMGQPMPQPVGQPSMMLPPLGGVGSGAMSRGDQLLQNLPQMMQTDPALKAQYDSLLQNAIRSYDASPMMPQGGARFAAEQDAMQQLKRSIMNQGQPSMMLPPGFAQLSGDISATDSLKDAMSAGTRPRLPSAYDGMSDQLRDMLGLAPGEPLPTGPFAEPTSYMPPGLPQPTTGGLEVGMTLSPQEQALQQQLLGGAGGFFGQAVQPTQAREQAIFERMRAAQRPEEERQRLALEERLAGQGRLGVSSAAYGGATPEMLAMATAQEEARNRSLLGAMQQAQAEQMQQAGLGQQFLGAGYVPQAQLLAAAQPGIQQQQLAQQAQQFGTGLFGETMMSGLEARLLAEQARANLLGGVGSNVLAGMFTPQVNKAGDVISAGGGLDIGSIIDDVGSGLGGLFNTIFK